MLGCITIGRTLCLVLEFCPNKDLLHYVKIVKEEMDEVILLCHRQFSITSLFQFSLMKSKINLPTLRIFSFSHGKYRMEWYEIYCYYYKHSFIIFEFQRFLNSKGIIHRVFINFCVNISLYSIVSLQDLAARNILIDAERNAKVI